MADEHHGQQAGGPSFAQIAKRISGWTSNCLLTALIVVAGLGFGRQVLRWWSTAAPTTAPSPSPSDVSDNPAAVRDLQFGNHPWVLRQQSVGGDPPTAARALRALCRDIVASARPTEQADPTETALLADLAGRAPVEQSPGQWQLFEFRQGFLAVLCTRYWPAASPGPGRAGKKLAEAAPRVVAWGLGVPAGRQAWSLYVFQPVAAQEDSRLVGPALRSGEVPIPPQSSRILSIRVASGGTMAAFAGPPRPAAWTQFYDQWFAAHGWTLRQPWGRLGTHWHVSFASSEPRPALAEIQFAPDERGGLRGFLIVTCPPTDGNHP
ncbi:MAG: hypothetical protein ABSG68_10565 [Thermoguttaceae bacterium]|jgi:hypothetical protein